MMERDSRMKLIRTATRLFADKGFAEVSIRELARAADVNSALIAYYFGGKKGLYEAVLEDYFQRIEERVAKTAMSQFEPIEKLRELINNVASIHREMPYLQKFLSREFINPSSSGQLIIKKYIFRVYKMFLDIVTAGGAGQATVREGIIPHFVPLAVAGMVHFYFMAQSAVKRLASVFPGIDDEEVFLAQIQEICLYGILRNREGEKEQKNSNS